ncbi:TIGR04013 family B12-binding domain/radical SAM domain-containing protein [Methanococcus voltae]|uniref:B12-binding domain/radical SAM domain protein n=1 Tax=Methanococcus voltae TaxID=2188 RepID=A0A8J7RNE7_METVO|nr:TIGR04013 family B12-binding domain/radical SAM domain-containing protein [Methanococcus voltae]MBP2173237.1 B12-binding domain/radical SAM domain protein [Methanococcus voltae]MBP2202101.1 B12-binding domain/radical SAM domain protein [Methanococcus voltae]
MIGYRLTSKNKYSISKLYPLTKGILFNNLDELIYNLKTNEIEKSKSCCFKVINSKNIIIYSFMTLQRPEVSKEINILRNNFKDLILIAGGPHASGAPEDTLKMGFDYVLVGEGEITLPDLINKINNNQYIENNVIKGIPIDSFKGYDEIYPLAPIEITRGCPYNCRFCQTPQIFGKNIRHRSIEDIIKIVKNMKDIRFVTPNALSYGSKYATKPNLEKLEELLKKLSIFKERLFLGTFPSEVRPEFINEDTLNLIVNYCDNKYLHFGAQSGCDEMLTHIRRGHTVNDVINAVDLCKKNKLMPKVDFIFGFPSETMENRIRSIQLMKYIIKKNGKVHAHYFMPLPGTYFENEKPTELDRETIKILGSMAKKGQISGSWTHQYNSTKVEK